MAGIGKLQARLTLDNKQFENNLKKSRREVQTFTQKAGAGFKRLGKAIFSMKGAMVAFVGVMAMRGAFRALDNAVDKLDKIGKTADVVGLTTDALQELTYAANRAGVGTETFYKSMKKLNEGIGDAIIGKGVLKDIIEKYGIELRHENGALKTNEELFGNIANVIQKTTNHQEKLNIASKAFGQRGADLIVLLNKGATGLQEYTARARELGRVVEESLIRDMEVARDKIDDLKDVIGTQLTIALASAAPSVANLGVAFAEALPSMVAFMEQLFVADEKQGIGTLEVRLKDIRDQIKETQKAISTPILGGGAGSFDESRGKASQQEELNKLRADELNLAIRIGNKATEQEAIRQRSIADAEKQADLRIKLSQAENKAAKAKQAADEAEKQKDKDKAAAARAAAKAADKLANDAERELIALDAKVEAWKKIADPTRVYTQEIEKLNAALLAGQINEEVYAGNLAVIAENLREIGKAAEDTDDKTDKLKKTAAEMGATFTSAFEEAILNGGELGDVIKGLADDIIRMMLRMAILDPLAGALGGMFEGLLGGGKAGGGTIQPGKIIPVGERGIEYITTPGPARVLTSQAARNLAGGGSQSVKVEIVSNGTPQQVENSTASMDAEGAVIQIVINDIQRNQAIPSALGSLYGLRRTA